MPCRKPPPRRDTTAIPGRRRGTHAATHCTRCTREPSRANEASTEAHAPTRRSCSSAPSSAKLPPRSDSAAVSVRPARSCTTPMSRQSARQQAHPAVERPMRRAPQMPVPARPPAHDDREPLVAGPAGHGHRRQRAVQDEDADGRGHADGVGLPAQHEHTEDQPHGHRHDLPGAPARPARRRARGARTGSATRRSPLTRRGPGPAATPAAASLREGPSLSPM